MPPRPLVEPMANYRTEEPINRPVLLAGKPAPMRTISVHLSATFDTPRDSHGVVKPKIKISAESFEQAQKTCEDTRGRHFSSGTWSTNDQRGWLSKTFTFDLQDHLCISEGKWRVLS